MLTQLEKYYDEVGILSTNFHCQYFDQCVSGFKDLVKGKAAYIGMDYEEHTLPRILFVSLEWVLTRTMKGQEIERHWE